VPKPEEPLSWGTDRIISDLNERLRADRWLVCNEVWLDDRGHARADLMALPRKFSARTALLFEVKTSRADLTGELRSGKWRKYLQHGAVAFAYPMGLAKLTEIPKECAAIVRHTGGWRWERAPRWQRAPEMTPYLWMRLAMSVSDEALDRGMNTWRPRAVAAHKIAWQSRLAFAHRVSQIALKLPHYEEWTARAETEWQALYSEVQRLRDQKETLEAQVANVRIQLTKLQGV
jgi:hypothetical protein